MGLEKISEYKKKLGLTNEELAKLSGVPKGTLDKILSGVTKDPKLNTLKALAKVFNCTLDDFDDEDNILLKSDNLSQEETTLLENFNKLNDLGKKEANKRVEELSEISKYIDYSLSACAMAKLDTEDYTLAAHDDGLDEETKKRNLEKAKAMFKQMDEE